MVATEAGAETGFMDTETLTPVQAAQPSSDDLRWASADILRITVSQMRAWEAEAARHGVVQPCSDEEAWEGTEIDIRRTVL